MLDGIRGRGHGTGTDLAGRGPQVRQQLSGAAADVLVRLSCRLTFRLPGGAWLGERLVGAGFIFTPHLQPERFPQAIGAVDQLFFGVASGSVIGTMPRFRRRRAVPVEHQVRFCW